MEKEISKKAAEIYARKDWHKLSAEERDLVRMLERGRYILLNKPENGFVGKAAHAQ